MSKLIDELKGDHETIVSVLEQIRKLGIVTEEAQELLRAAKSGLLAHLAKEDKYLYPVLLKEAEKDSALNRMLTRYAEEMTKISQAALDFFDKYASGGDTHEFARDFGRLMGVLGTRIRTEENFIYTRFDEISQ